MNNNRICRPFDEIETAMLKRQFKKNYKDYRNGGDYRSFEHGYINFTAIERIDFDDRKGHFSVYKNKKVVATHLTTEYAEAGWYKALLEILYIPEQKPEGGGEDAAAPTPEPQQKHYVQVGVSAMRDPFGNFLPAVPIYAESKDVNHLSGLTSAEESVAQDISGLFVRKYKEYNTQVAKAKREIAAARKPRIAEGE